MKKILCTLSFGFFCNSGFAIDVGQIAPSFSLLNQHNETVTLQQYQNKWVVLYFYPKADTPGCTKESCSFRDHINKLIAKRAVIIGVSVDSPKEQLNFAQKHNLPFSLLADEDGQVAKAYDSLRNFGIIKFARRNSFIIDPKGHIAKVYLSVDPEEHVKEVMEDLRELQHKQ